MPQDKDNVVENSQKESPEKPSSENKPTHLGHVASVAPSPQKVVQKAQQEDAKRPPLETHKESAHQPYVGKELRAVVNQAKKKNRRCWIVLRSPSDVKAVESIKPDGFGVKVHEKQGPRAIWRPM